ncbi:MAG: CRTAC1 family protein [Candidatus Korobacteraceae bacterium]|jgi:enediyne biosynthesis protein E4
MEPSRHPQAKKIAATVIALGALGVAWMYRPAPVNAHTIPGLKDRFSFRAYDLPTLPGPQQTTRQVNGSLAHIDGWISSVGAAVAINDIDGDGLANDICYVDTRTDQVIVAPAPGTPARYAPFALDPSPVKVDKRTTAPMGCLPGDFDEDGRIDLLVYYWGRTPIVFLNHYDRSKQHELNAQSFQAVDLVPGGERWFTNAAVLADLDGDGHVDIVIGNYFPDGADILDPDNPQPQHMQSSMSHAYNGGDKHFLLWQPPAPGAPIRFRDVVPEFLVGNYRPVSATLQDEILHGWTLALGAADLNGDLLPELYIANDFGPDRLLENLSSPGHLKFRLLEGARTFFTPKSKVLGHDSFKGMGVDFANLKGDGRLDILVGNITDEFALEESNFAFVPTDNSLTDQRGIAHYQDESEELGISRTGWTWDVKAADFDNEGAPQIVLATGFLNSATAREGIDRWPELHEIAMGNDVLLQYPWAWHRFKDSDALSSHNHTPFFVMNRDGTYSDISQEIGLEHIYPGRGIAVADVRGDGLLDFAIANQWGTSVFYQNTSVSHGAALTLRLLLPTHTGVTNFRIENGSSDSISGSPAIGATASLRLPNGRVLVDQVNGGNGHSGKNSFEIHFGLGRQDPSQRYQVILNWRDRGGKTNTHSVSLVAGRYSVLLGQ